MAIRSKYWETVPGPYPESAPFDRLTKEGVDYLMQHQKAPPKDAVKADSAGLRMTERLDDSNRPIREFELPHGATKRGTWMAPYCGEMYEQVRICKTPQTVAQNEAAEARWRATRAMIASGKITLPEIG